MEHLAIINHNSFRAIGFHESRSPSSPYGPVPQGSQLGQGKQTSVVFASLGLASTPPRMIAVMLLVRRSSYGP